MAIRALIDAPITFPQTTEPARPATARTLKAMIPKLHVPETEEEHILAHIDEVAEAKPLIRLRAAELKPMVCVCH